MDESRRRTDRAKQKGDEPHSRVEAIDAIHK